MSLTSQQILISLDDLDCQMEQFVKEQRDESYALMINQRLAAIRYQYPDSACEYNEPRGKTWGRWWPLVVWAAGTSTLVAIARWLI